MFVMVDGITGSGKTTVVRAMRDWLEASGRNVFDLAEACERTRSIPEYEDVASYDVFLTFEPTRAWTGSAIREEMSEPGRGYSPLELAQAFAIDRHVLYRRLVLPALSAGKFVLQDRGFITSLAYQTQMDDGVDEKTLMRLPGNALAAQHVPDHLVLTDLEVDTALARLQPRPGLSRGIFQDRTLLERVQRRYKDPAFLKRFTAHGTRIHWLDTAASMEQSCAGAKTLIASILSTR